MHRLAGAAMLLGLSGCYFSTSSLIDKAEAVDHIERATIVNLQRTETLNGIPHTKRTGCKRFGPDTKPVWFCDTYIDSGEPVTREHLERWDDGGYILMDEAEPEPLSTAPATTTSDDEDEEFKSLRFKHRSGDFYFVEMGSGTLHQLALMRLSGAVAEIYVLECATTDDLPLFGEPEERGAGEALPCSISSISQAEPGVQRLLKEIADESRPPEGVIRIEDPRRTE